ncbi:MAG: Gfo/Idh/MocA family oxidoreductase [Eubacterium sp.]|jgi:Predicted dehydrogenases and related proteins|nr:Gfo/Idh/MocA family oxidoreductase [Eubacterium sp.]
MKKKVKVCLIGCGRAGMIHAKSYAGNVKNAELAALCDPVAENLKSAQEEVEVPYIYTDYKEVMKNDEIDAVIVVTPTKFHHEIVLAAANAGKHVFCEKPMAVDEKECDDMIQACRQNGVKLQLGFMRRFDKNFRRGKELIDSGEVGTVTSLRSNTHGPSEPKEWMFDVRNSYGPLGEVNSHDFDTLRWYAGCEVKKIHAIGHNFRSPEVKDRYPEYYDTCAVLLEFENGIVGTISGAQYVKYGYDSRAEILGTNGIVKVGTQKAYDVETVTEQQKTVSDSVNSWRTLFREAYVAEANSFIESIINDTEPEVTGHDGKMALRLVNAGLKSLLEKRPVELEP